MHSVVETAGYLSDAKAAGMTDAERAGVVALLASDPAAGDEMSGTGGARKVRVAGRGKGKSGGYRVVSFYSGPGVPVFLLAVFGKGDRDNLSQRERNEFKAALGDLVEAYRQSVRRHVQARKASDRKRP